MDLALRDFLVLFLAGGGFLFSFLIGFQLLARKDGVQQTNRLLGTLLIVIALSTINMIFSLIGLYSRYQFLYFLPLVFNLSIGPLFYFFVKSKVQVGFQLSLKRHWPHLILPLSEFGFYLAIGFRSAEYKSMIWRDVVAPYLQYIEEALFIASALYYILSARKLLKITPQKNWKVPVYRWLLQFSNILLILLMVHSVYEITDWFLYGLYEFNLFNEPWLDYPIKLADALIPLWLAFNAMKYQNALFPVVEIKQEASPTEKEPALVARIQEYLEQESAYLDPDFNLNSLSTALGSPKNSISKAIADSGDSFRKLLNRYRVNHFKSLAMAGENSHLSLLGLALESGFNSKASFNRAFKEETGATPSQFLNRAELMEVSN